MSCTLTPSITQEQSENEGTVELMTPYPNEIESFDNPKTYPDLEFVVAGMEKPLQLHRRILARASQWADEMLGRRKDTKLEWPYDTSKEMDREALVKALRFCYGETLCIGTKNGECCAIIATLTRLQVMCLDDVTRSLIKFAMDEANRNLASGVELLKACTGYKECCGTSQYSLDQQLAKIVLTKDNMYSHYKEIVDDCLMILPPDYLMLVEFGEPHTMCSKFCLRTRYIRFHSKDMSREEKQSMVVKCDWSTLNSQELRELRQADIVDKDKLLEAYEKALEYCEIEKKQTKKVMKERVKKLEKEKEQETTRVKELEKEMEELKRLVEKTEKEKGEVKQGEMDKDA